MLLEKIVTGAVLFLTSFASSCANNNRQVGCHIFLKSRKGKAGAYSDALLATSHTIGIDRMFPDAASIGGVHVCVNKQRNGDR